MVKRVVSTSFWTDCQVIDQYSVEDKYFALYLMTNTKSTQLGIYSLPKKIMSFETCYTAEVIEVLLNRFSDKYGEIIYSEKTQEVSLLKSLSFSILTGGKPVSDLLKREFRRVKDSQLILRTYQEMKSYWAKSPRRFDQSVKKIFEDEMTKRGILFNSEDRELNSGQIERKENPKEGMVKEEEAIENYYSFLNLESLQLNKKELKDNILTLFYQEKFGELTEEAEGMLKYWATICPKSLILEALLRSVGKHHPLSYADTIIDNWMKAEVTILRDVKRLDRQYTEESEVDGEL